MIPYGRQEIVQADVEAVVAAMNSDFLTQGPAVAQFERDVASYVQARRGVAANSATSALHLACRALHLGPEDWLWTSPITFVASANCALYCGARVDFVDIDSQSLNMSPVALDLKLRWAARCGRLPRVVVPVHFAGSPCDMHAIRGLGRDYGFAVIEDASHAIGGRYRGEPIGNCHYSDITIFSFHPVKIVTSAEGGMAMTNDEALADGMELLRSHGITRDPAAMRREPDGPWYYEQRALGYNYRLTDVQAALGSSQLRRLDAYVARRRYLARRYDELLSGLPIRTPSANAAESSAMHLYVIRVGADKRRFVFEHLRQQGIGVNVHYIPVHLQPHFSDMGYRRGDFPHAERYYDEAITLPLYPGLQEAEQERVVDALREALGL